MLETANFSFPWPDWPHPFLNMPTQKKFGLYLTKNIFPEGFVQEHNK